MRKITGIYRLLILFLNLSVTAAIDPTTSGLGFTLGRNVNGHSFEAAFNNPAILGINSTPKGGLILPLSNFSAGEWSDKLALSPINRYWVSDKEELSALITKVLKRSFQLDGLNEEEVARKMEEKLQGGLSIYSGFSTILLSIAGNRFGFDITTHFNNETKIPEGPLMILFGVDKGLRKGNKLDFSDLSQKAIWATDFSFLMGLPVNIPALHNFFRLEQGAGGVGLKYVMGHSALMGETKSGSLYYNENTNEVEVDGSVNVRTAGCGFSGPWRFENPFSNGLPVSGHGIGVDIGGILYNKRAKFSINVQNLGVIFWMKDAKEANYQLKDKNVNAYDIIDGIEKAEDNNGKAELYIFDQLVNDTLQKTNAFTTLLPLSLNIGYSYSWDFSKSHPMLAQYVNVAANYEQQLDGGPGRSYIPRISIGGETGMLRGHFPFRIGYVFGGPEKIASAFGFGIKARVGTFNFSCKSIGTPVWVPKRGLELAAGYQLNWGMTSDADKDGIMDKDDQCPSAPEDRDGYMDQDGCPDFDNDQDNIPDSLDRCPNAAEDRDDFEDDDGCPDYDNDNDGVADSLDKCINEPEDLDNYQDEDGCPDLDNDKDGIEDKLDKCPLQPEDFDRFEDDDGCPDYDNDRDGVADTLDKCPDTPEVYNGFRDDDGCPDTLVKPTEKETKVLNTKLKAINFKSGSAVLLPGSFAALDYIVSFLKQYSHLRYEIQGHTDSQGSDEFNLVLSAARAATVRGYLLLKGIQESNLIAIGYGESMPLADNNTAGGRAINRRVEFEIIETNDQYNVLKEREAVIREMVKKAKIKSSY